MFVWFEFRARKHLAKSHSYVVLSWDWLKNVPPSDNEYPLKSMKPPQRNVEMGGYYLLIIIIYMSMIIMSIIKQKQTRIKRKKTF